MHEHARDWPVTESGKCPENCPYCDYVVAKPLNAGDELYERLMADSPSGTIIPLRDPLPIWPFPPIPYDQNAIIERMIYGRVTHVLEDGAGI